MWCSSFHVQVHHGVRKEHFEKCKVVLTKESNAVPVTENTSVHYGYHIYVAKRVALCKFIFLPFASVPDWFRHMVCRMLATVSFLALQIQEAICYLYILLGTNTIQSPLKQLNFGSYPSILSWLVYTVSWKGITEFFAKVVWQLLYWLLLVFSCIVLHLPCNFFPLPLC